MNDYIESDCYEFCVIRMRIPKICMIKNPGVTSMPYSTTSVNRDKRKKNWLFLWTIGLKDWDAFKFIFDLKNR